MNWQMGMREAICMDSGDYVMTADDFTSRGEFRRSYPLLEAWASFDALFKTNRASLPAHQAKIVEMLVWHLHYFANSSYLFSGFGKLKDDEKQIFLDLISGARENIGDRKRLGNFSFNTVSYFQRYGGYSLYSALEIKRLAGDMDEPNNERILWLKRLGDFLWSEIEAVSRTSFVPPIQTIVENAHDIFRVPEGHKVHLAFFDDRALETDADAPISDKKLIMYLTCRPETGPVNFEISEVKNFEPERPLTDSDKNIFHSKITSGGFTGFIIDGDVVPADGYAFTTFEILYDACGKKGSYQLFRAKILFELRAIMSAGRTAYPSLQELQYFGDPEEAMEYVRLCSTGSSPDFENSEGNEYQVVRLPKNARVPSLFRSIVARAAEKFGIKMQVYEFLAHPEYTSPQKALEIARANQEKRIRSEKKKPIGGETDLRYVRKVLKRLGCDIQTERGEGSHIIATRRNEKGEFKWTTIPSERGRHVRRDQLLPCLRQLGLSKEEFEFAAAE